MNGLPIDGASLENEGGELSYLEGELRIINPGVRRTLDSACPSL